MRRNRPALLLVLGGLLLAAACARTRPLLSVAALEPGPLLAVLEQRAARISGLLAEIEMNFHDGDRRYRGSAYLRLATDGRFRIEVPGPWGSTALVLVCDGSDLWAYYPEKNLAYHTVPGGRSLSPYLPFPFEMEIDSLPASLSGVLGRGNAGTGARAFLLSSGQAALLLQDGDREERYTFSGPREGELDRLEITDRRGSLSVEFSGRSPSLPTRFEYRGSGAVMKGRLRDVRVPSDAPDHPFLPPQPPDAPVTELGAGT